MQIVNINRGEKYTVYIGRGSVFGNIYTHLPLHQTRALVQVKSRKESIEKYESYAREQIKSNAQYRSAMMRLTDDDILGCYCVPERCHGEIIIKLWQELNHVDGGQTR